MDLVFHILVGTLGFWLADRFVPGVDIIGPWYFVLILGLVFGIINGIIKPLISALTFPLKILTLGLFGFLLDILIVWGIDIIFPELIIAGIIPLFLTTVILWILSYFWGLKK